MANCPKRNVLYKTINNFKIHYVLINHKTMSGLKNILIHKRKINFTLSEIKEKISKRKAYVAIGHKVYLGPHNVYVQYFLKL